MTLILSDGRRIDDVILAGGSDIVKVKGRQVSDAKDLDFSVTDIVDVKRKRLRFWERVRPEPRRGLP